LSQSQTAGSAQSCNFTSPKGPRSWSLDYPDTFLNALTYSDVLTDIISHKTKLVNDCLSAVKALADRKNYYVITLVTGFLFPL
jgi:hypothetical protein